MAIKVFAGLLILACVVGGQLYFMHEYVEIVENLIGYTGDMISESSISEGISVFYSFEEDYYDAEKFLSLFVHDVVLEDVRVLMAEVRTAYFNGDRSAANSGIVMLREKLMQLYRSVLPTVENVM